MDERVERVGIDGMRARDRVMVPERATAGEMIEYALVGVRAVDELPRGALTELVEVPGGGDDFDHDASRREHAAELIIIGGREHIERASDGAVEDGDRGEVGDEPGDAIIGIEAGGKLHRILRDVKGADLGSGSRAHRTGEVALAASGIEYTGHATCRFSQGGYLTAQGLGDRLVEAVFEHRAPQVKRLAAIPSGLLAPAQQVHISLAGKVEAMTRLTGKRGAVELERQAAYRAGEKCVAPQESCALPFVHVMPSGRWCSMLRACQRL